MKKINLVILIASFYLTLLPQNIYAENDNPVFYKYDYINYINLEPLEFENFIKTPSDFRKTSNRLPVNIYTGFGINTYLNAVCSTEIIFPYNSPYRDSSNINKLFVNWNNEEKGTYDNILSKNILEFLNYDNLNSMLKSHNIYENIEDFYIVNVKNIGNSYFPAIIWINTKSDNNYFFVFNGNGGDTFYCNLDTKKLEFMTCDELYNKYSIRSGRIYLNYADIGTDKLMFQANNYVYVPFRDLVQSLGSVVIWNNANRSATFYFKDKKYTMYNDRYNYVINRENNGGFNGGFIYYNTVPFINGNMYIDKDFFYDIVEIFNVECRMDFDNNIIYLNKR